MLNRNDMPDRSLDMAYLDADIMERQLKRTADIMDVDAKKTQLKADALPNHPDSMDEYRRLYTMMSDSAEIRAMFYEACSILNQVKSITAKYKKR